MRRQEIWLSRSYAGSKPRSTSPVTSSSRTTRKQLDITADVIVRVDWWVYGRVVMGGVGIRQLPGMYP